MKYAHLSTGHRLAAVEALVGATELRRNLDGAPDRENEMRAK